MVMTREDMKDRVLVALLSCLITSSGWFILWAKDVPTLEKLEAKPPILTTIPALKEKIDNFSQIRDTVITIQAKVMTIQQVQSQLTSGLKDLQQAMATINDQIIDIKLSLARLRAANVGKVLHPPYTDVVEGNGGADRS